MVCCAAYGCSSVSGRDKVGFFSFPTNTTLRKLWIERLGRSDERAKGRPYIPGIHSKLCSKHFENDAFVKDDLFLKSIGFEGKFKRKLKPDAVPTLFVRASQPKRTGPSANSLLDKRRNMNTKCEDVKEGSILQRGSNDIEEKSNLPTVIIVGHLKKEKNHTTAYSRENVTEYLEPPSNVSSFYVTGEHTLYVYWKPVKNAAKLDGYKVMISKDGAPWTLLKVTGIVRSYFKMKTSLTGRYKIGVCSFRGSINSDIVDTKGDVKHSVPSLPVEKKYSSRGYLLKSGLPSSYYRAKIDPNRCHIKPWTKIKMQPLPYHKVISTPIQLTALPLSGLYPSYLEKTYYCFCLEKKLVSHILNSRDLSFGTFGVQVLVRFCLFDEVTIQQDVIPECIVRVNGELALVQHKDKDLGGPLDITKLCHFKEGKESDDHLCIEWMPSPKMNYIVTVCVAEKLAIPDIVSKWMVENVKDPSTTRQMIQDKLKSDTDVSCTSLKMTLKCPLGKTRIVSPCRGQNCTHLQCVDAVTLLKLNEGRPLLGGKCYMCDKPVGSTYIDGLFLEILHSVPDTVDEIEFRHDGSWTYSGKDDSPPPELSCEPSESLMNTEQTISQYSDETRDDVVVSDGESEEENIFQTITSRLSRIKSQVDQLEILSRQHEQFNLKAVDSLEVNHTDDDGKSIVVDSSEDKVVDLSEDKVIDLSEDEVKYLSGDEVIDLSENEVKNENFSDVGTTCITICNHRNNITICNHRKSMRNKAERDLEQKDKEKERILENEIARMLQDVKQSAKMGKRNECGEDGLLNVAVIDDEASGTSGRQGPEKAVLEIGSFDKIINESDMTQRIETSNTDWSHESSDIVKDITSSESNMPLVMNEDDQDIKNEDSEDYQDIKNEGGEDEQDVKNEGGEDDQDAKNEGGGVENIHSSGKLRMVQDSDGLQLHNLNTEDGMCAEVDFNLGKIKMETCNNQFDLLKPDGTGVSYSDLGYSGIFIPVFSNKSKISETDCTEKMESCQVTLDSVIELKSNESLVLIDQSENNVTHLNNNLNTTIVKNETQVTEIKDEAVISGRTRKESLQLLSRTESATDGDCRIKQETVNNVQKDNENILVRKQVHQMSCTSQNCDSSVNERPEVPGESSVTAIPQPGTSREQTSLITVEKDEPFALESLNTTHGPGIMEPNKRRGKRRKLIIDKETEFSWEHYTNLASFNIYKGKHDVKLAPPTKKLMKMAEVGINRKADERMKKSHALLVGSEFLRNPSRPFLSKALLNLYNRNLPSSLKKKERYKKSSDGSESQAESDTELSYESNNDPVESILVNSDSDTDLKEQVIEIDSDTEELFKNGSNLKEQVIEIDSDTEELCKNGGNFEEPVIEIESDTEETCKNRRGNLEEPVIEIESDTEKPCQNRRSCMKTFSSTSKGCSADDTKLQCLLCEVKYSNKEEMENHLCVSNIKGCRKEHPKRILRAKTEKTKTVSLQSDYSKQTESVQSKAYVDCSTSVTSLKMGSCRLRTKPLRVTDEFSGKAQQMGVHTENQPIMQQHQHPQQEDDRNEVQDEMDVERYENEVEHRLSEEENLVIAENRPKLKRGRKYSKSPMPCPHCSETFKDEPAFNLHLYKHTKVKPFICEIAGCEHRFLSKFNLERHMLVHTSPRNHICSYCDKRFNRIDHLKSHITTHDPNKKMWKCELCGKVYSAIFSFKCHMAFHAADQGKTLTCEICKKVYESKEQLLVHLKGHSGYKQITEKVHPCHDCGKNFDTRRALKRHTLVHTKEKDFLCQYCPKRFGRRDHFVRHVRMSHTGDKQSPGRKNKNTGASSIPSQPKRKSKKSVYPKMQPTFILVPLQMAIQMQPEGIQKQLTNCISATQAKLLPNVRHAVLEIPGQHIATRDTGAQIQATLLEASTAAMSGRQQQLHQNVSAPKVATASLNSINPTPEMPEMQHQLNEKGNALDNYKLEQSVVCKVEVPSNVEYQHLPEQLQGTDPPSLQHEQQQLQLMQTQRQHYQTIPAAVKIEPEAIETTHAYTRAGSLKQPKQNQIATTQLVSSLVSSNTSAIANSSVVQALPASFVDSRQTFPSKDSTLPGYMVTRGQTQEQYNEIHKKRKLLLKLDKKKSRKDSALSGRNCRWTVSVYLKRKKELDRKDYKIYV